MLTTYAGGLIGSVCQLSAFTEISTLFVNMRTILAYHKLQKSTLYVANGVMMTWMFFWARVVFYSYMIFGVLLDYCVYRSHSFWSTYDDQTRPMMYFSLALYLLMYLLNLFWFVKIFMGLAKAFGLVGKVQTTERTKKD